MNLLPKTRIAAALLAAFCLFSTIRLAADPAKPEAVAAQQAQASDKSVVTPTPAPAAPLRELAPEPTPAEDAKVQSHGDDEGNDRVSVQGSTYVGSDEMVPGNAVAVMGSVTVDGTVNGNAVAVMGKNTINGTVHGNAVAVLGGLKLGPKAHVDGNAVCVGGVVTREPGAYVGGSVVKQASVISFSDDSGAASWWEHGLSKGRPLAIGPHLLFFWFFQICLIALYVVLALAFPGGMAKCGETLVRRPGITLLTGVLSVLALPVLFILLLVTVVGIPVAFVILPLGVLSAMIFGRTAVYALVGRAILGKQLNPALAVLVGVAVFSVFYFVPILGLMLWCLVAFLGYASALTTLFTLRSQPAPAPTAPAAPAAGIVPPVPVAAAAPLGATPLAVSGEPPVMGSAPSTELPGISQAFAGAAAPVAPPPVSQVPPAAPPAAAAPVSPLPHSGGHAAVHSQAGLPRAGFWIRMVALFLDMLLIAALTSGLEHTTVHVLGHGSVVSSGGSLFPLAIAIYGAVLWKIKGSTIGGIIFGLSVMRVDDRPMDWTTAIVRALACFFSMIAIGLGFLWIAFDPEKQAWHDKIAGTVVVRLPKGVSLV